MGAWTGVAETLCLPYLALSDPTPWSPACAGTPSGSPVSCKLPSSPLGPFTNQLAVFPNLFSCCGSLPQPRCSHAALPTVGRPGGRPLSVCPNASSRSLHTVGAQFMSAPVGDAGESHGQVLRAAGSCSPGPAHPSPPSRSLPDTPVPEAIPPPDLPGCTLGTHNVQPWHLTSTEHGSLLHEAASFLSRERAKVTEHLLPFSPRPQCHHLTGSY